MLKKGESTWTSTWLCLFLLVENLIISNNKVFDMCLYYRTICSNKVKGEDNKEVYWRIFIKYFSNNGAWFVLFWQQNPPKPSRNAKYILINHPWDFFFCGLLVRKVYHRKLLTSVQSLDLNIKLTWASHFFQTHCTTGPLRCIRGKTHEKYQLLVRAQNEWCRNKMILKIIHNSKSDAPHFPAWGAWWLEYTLAVQAPRGWQKGQRHGGKSSFRQPLEALRFVGR